MLEPLLPSGYATLLSALNKRIAEERVHVVLGAHATNLLLYWETGGSILAQQTEEGWGARVIDRMSADLRHAVPDMSGLSARNLKYMRAFAAAWPDRAIVQQAVAQLPWGHNLVLLDRLPDAATRLWYARKAREEGWSRNILALQIQRSVFEREGKAKHKFSASLPPPDSDLATAMFKDPCLFDFIGTADLRREAEAEQALMDHLVARPTRVAGGGAPAAGAASVERLGRACTGSRSATGGVPVRPGLNRPQAGSRGTVGATG